MAKYGLLHNRKFKRLEMLLRLPRPHILGHLEMLWMSQAMAETDVIGDSDDLEMLAEWTGDHGALTEALVQAGFVYIAADVYVIHDFWEHAPPYLIDRVSKRLSMSKKAIRDGEHVKRSLKIPENPGKSQKIPEDPLLKEKNRKEQNRKEPLKRCSPAQGRDGCAGGFDADRFEQFWTAYPRKVGKAKCRAWWAKHKPSAALLDEMLEAVQRATGSIQWQKDGGAFIPHPITWLNRGGWDDEYGPVQDGVYGDATDARKVVPF